MSASRAGCPEPQTAGIPGTAPLKMSRGKLRYGEEERAWGWQMRAAMIPITPHPNGYTPQPQREAGKPSVPERTAHSPHPRTRRPAAAASPCAALPDRPLLAPHSLADSLRVLGEAGTPGPCSPRSEPWGPLSRSVTHEQPGGTRGLLPLPQTVCQGANTEACSCCVLLHEAPRTRRTSSDPEPLAALLLCAALCDGRAALPAEPAPPPHQPWSSPALLSAIRLSCCRAPQENTLVSQAFTGFTGH